MHSDSTDAIRYGLERAKWTIADLWVAAAAVGGPLSRHDVEQIVTGARQATPREHDVLATALNDHFTELGEDHPIRCWEQLTTS
jgi:hypothetical protein